MTSAGDLKLRAGGVQECTPTLARRVMLDYAGTRGEDADTQFEARNKAAAERPGYLLVKDRLTALTASLGGQKLTSDPRALFGGDALGRWRGLHGAEAKLVADRIRSVHDRMKLMGYHELRSASPSQLQAAGGAVATVQLYLRASDTTAPVLTVDTPDGSLPCVLRACLGVKHALLRLDPIAPLPCGAASHLPAKEKRFLERAALAGAHDPRRLNDAALLRASFVSSVSLRLLREVAAPDAWESVPFCYDALCAPHAPPLYAASGMLEMGNALTTKYSCIEELLFDAFSLGGFNARWANGTEAVFALSESFAWCGASMGTELRTRLSKTAKRFFRGTVQDEIKRLLEPRSQWQQSATTTAAWAMYSLSTCELPVTFDCHDVRRQDVFTVAPLVHHGALYLLVVELEALAQFRQHVLFESRETRPFASVSISSEGGVRVESLDPVSAFALRTDASVVGDHSWISHCALETIARCRAAGTSVEGNTERDYQQFLADAKESGALDVQGRRLIEMCLAEITLLACHRKFKGKLQQRDPLLSS